jgi:hypothetical protein
MVHSGFEATAVKDTMANPLKALKVSLFGPRLDGPMAPEIPLTNQRPAEDVYAKVVHDGLERIEAEKRAKAATRETQSA